MFTRNAIHFWRLGTCQAASCVQKLNTAQRLVSGLADENERSETQREVGVGNTGDEYMMNTSEFYSFWEVWEVGDHDSQGMRLKFPRVGK